VSIFGSMRFSRVGYYIPKQGNYYPFDEHMCLPKKQLSYTLQNWIGKRSTEEDYRNSVELFNEVLGLKMKGSEVKRIVEDLGPSVSDYYADRPVLTDTELKEEGTHLAFGNDGKGVPIIKEERQESGSTKKTGQGGRLMKGQKRGVKKEATVAVDFSFNPAPRDSETILRGLFKEPSQTPPKERKAKRISINVHKRAFLEDQKGAIDYAIKRLVERSKTEDKRIIALVDCGSGLEEGIVRLMEENGVTDKLDAIIADVVHVSEYVWDAANVIVGETYQGRPQWVRDVMKDLLESKTEKVIADLQANLDKTDLTESKQDKLKTVIRYLTNHKHKMDYQTYLKKGYPISTGLIEGCCGHLVKDRMERSGMRWTKVGAQNMMDLRAVKKNDDWDDFMQFVQRNNRESKLIRA